MKLLFITNLPSPYRMDFFNKLGLLSDLTVCFERKSAADRATSWRGQDAVNFHAVYSQDRPLGADKSIGFNLLREVKRRSYDYLIISGYSSPAVMILIMYCKMKNIPYCIESDGGFLKKDAFGLRSLKRFFLGSAEAHLTTCEEHSQYLQTLGVSENDIYKYPFTSLLSSDILPKAMTGAEKVEYRNALDLKDQSIIISVGQFIHRKGYDVLLRAACSIDTGISIYIIGGTPTPEYLRMKEEYGLNNVHFVGFKTKEELKKWYYAADAFVLPTREDIWGLVVNEAMAAGLPVITTNRCIAGLELIRDGENGYIVPVENAEELVKKILIVFKDPERQYGMAQESLRLIKPYTIENMAIEHVKILASIRK